jgi:hypothetical protein
MSGLVCPQLFTSPHHLRSVLSKKSRVRAKLAAKAPAVDFLIARERMNETGAAFLKLDVEMGLTFVDTARQTNDLSRRRRNRRSARKAYDTVLRLTKKVHLNQEDARSVAQGLDRLKSELESMGESF